MLCSTVCTPKICWYLYKIQWTLYCLNSQFCARGLSKCTVLCKNNFEHQGWSAKAGFSPQNHAKHLNCRGRPQDWQNWLTAETSSKTMQFQSSFLWRRLLHLYHWSVSLHLLVSNTSPFNRLKQFLRMCYFGVWWHSWKRPQRTSDGTSLLGCHQVNIRALMI